MTDELKDAVERAQARASEETHTPFPSCSYSAALIRALADEPEVIEDLIAPYDLPIWPETMRDILQRLAEIVK